MTGVECKREWISRAPEVVSTACYLVPLHFSLSRGGALLLVKVASNSVDTTNGNLFNGSMSRRRTQQGSR